MSNGSSIPVKGQLASASSSQDDDELWHENIRPKVLG
jgi:hypothetical protein